MFRSRGADSLVGVDVAHLAEPSEGKRLVLKLDRQSAAEGVGLVLTQGLLHVGVLERRLHRAAQRMATGRNTFVSIKLQAGGALRGAREGRNRLLLASGTGSTARVPRFNCILWFPHLAAVRFPASALPA